MVRIFLLVLLLGALPVASRAQGAGGGDVAWLDASACAPCPMPLLRTLPSAWREFYHFVQLCPVTDPHGQVALEVMTPRIDLAEAAVAQGRGTILGFFSRQGSIPPPSLYLIDSRKNIVGEIPLRFPLDPPDRVELGFSRWQDGFPRRVEARKGGGTIQILSWDAAEHWFRFEPPLQP
jgi:hypothetical protein